jgi:hypothetical protein
MVRRRSASAFALAFVLASALVTAARASAAAEPHALDHPASGRPCNEADLAGAYSLVEYIEEAVGPSSKVTDSAHFRYLVFSPGKAWGGVGFPAKAPEVLTSFVVSERAHASLTYEIRDGRLLLDKDGAPLSAFRCTVSQSNGDGYEKDDLILAGGDANMPFRVTELYRRWQRVDPAHDRYDLPATPSAFSSGLSWCEHDDTGERCGTWNFSKGSADIANGAGAEIQLAVERLDAGGVVVTNEGQAPLVAVAMVFHHAKNGPDHWGEAFDMCLYHRPPIPPAKGYTSPEIVEYDGKTDEVVTAALFADGSTWGDPQHVAQLKARHASCDWPGY